MYKIHKFSNTCNTAESVLLGLQNVTNVIRGTFKGYYTSSDMMRHIRIHTGENLFQCTICAKSFNGKGHLNKHMRTHTGEHWGISTAELGKCAKRHQCTSCGYTSIRSADLKRHIRIHTGERPYPCTICAKSFNEKGHLNKHMRTHTGEHIGIKLARIEKSAGRRQISSYDCTTDYSAFMIKPTRIHMGERPVQCAICMKRFQRKSHFNNHMRTHTESALQILRISSARLAKCAKRHQCSSCGYTSTRSADIKRHIRTHTGEKPFQCTICAKSFTEKFNLNSHMRTHTGERPFSCPECDKAFSRKENMKAHLISYHFQ
ncbi:hypothetical protein CEXT_98261 [Caerostris extrusa]|uniref:C2H2-type domain-containing protein n=1 Tax=Caerostris extrusa TaxID=172846 RepID=A0AAV4PH70_CAEEX|nr:hypothetical protein CEXT_98261 [Caerostris extrusa]